MEPGLEARPGRYDLYVKPQGMSRFKVNPRGTQAFAGNIDGSTLVYHQRSRRRKSDIKFLDLVTGARSEPAGVNTRRNFESQGSRSGDWLLFWRQCCLTPSRQKIILRNLATGEQRLLAVGRSLRRWTQPGRVSGNFVTYTKCRNRSFCNTFRYDIATDQATKIPNLRRQVLAAASVSSDGTAYFSVGEDIFTCEDRSSLWRFTIAGRRIKILSLGPLDAATTSPLMNADGTTTLFYDAFRRCRTSDVFKVTVP